MKASVAVFWGTRNADSRGWHWLGSVLCLNAFLLLQGCSHKAEEQLQLKEAVVGSWANVDGSNENLEFGADGTLLMKSPRRNEVCRYDFPDAKHIRLDCAPAGMPPRPYAWNFSLTADDNILIGDGHETGTYQKK
jgi:hypothetical protein